MVLGAPTGTGPVIFTLFQINRLKNVSIYRCHQHVTGSRTDFLNYLPCKFIT